MGAAEVGVRVVVGLGAIEALEVAGRDPVVHAIGDVSAWSILQAPLGEKIDEDLTMVAAPERS